MCARACDFLSLCQQNNCTQCLTFTSGFIIDALNPPVVHETGHDRALRGGPLKALRLSNAIKVKVHTLDIAIGRSHTCLCLPSYIWYSFTDPGGMEG